MRALTITCIFVAIAAAAGAAVCPIGFQSGTGVADAAIDGSLGAPR